MNTAKAAVGRISTAVVQIVVSANLPSGERVERAIAGTGFFVAGNEYIATSAHVLTKTQKNLQEKGATDVTFAVNLLGKDVKAEIVTHGTFLNIPAALVSADEENDLALLKTPTTVGKSGLHLVAEIVVNGSPKKFELIEVSNVSFYGGTVETGEDVLVAGFPLQAPFLVVQRGIISATPTYPIKGTSKEREEIVLDIMVNPGNSGGPVFLASNGFVIGICRAHQLTPVLTAQGTASDAFQNAGLSLVTPVRYLRDMLDSLRVCYSTR
jgi:S1-C subfamily serine protease